MANGLSYSCCLFSATKAILLSTIGTPTHLWLFNCLRPKYCVWCNPSLLLRLKSIRGQSSLVSISRLLPPSPLPILGSCLTNHSFQSLCRFCENPMTKLEAGIEWDPSLQFSNSLNQTLGLWFGQGQRAQGFSQPMGKLQFLFFKHHQALKLRT